MAEVRIITVSDAGCVNVKTVDVDTSLCHRYVLLPGDDLAGRPSDVANTAKEAWTTEVVAAWKAAHPGPTTEELARIAAMQASDAARRKAIITNLPSWTQVDAAITNIGNLADAKAFIRKLARVVYWLAKNTEA